MMFSSSSMQSDLFLDSIKKEIEQNPLLLQDYGPLAGESYGQTWRGGDIVCCHPIRLPNGEFKRDDKGLLIPDFTTRLTARGAESSTRGLRHGAYRPDLVLLDDAESDEHVLTPEQRVKLKQWWHKAVEPMLDPNIGVSIVVGTILHFDSLLSYLLTRTDVYDTFKYAAIQPDGTSLWPERWPLDKLEEERLRLGTAAFSQEYMNNPLDDDARKFRPEWLQFYTINDVEFHAGVWTWRGQKLKIYQAYDLAIRQREQADQFAYAVIGITGEHHIIILQCTGEHMDFPRQVRTVIEQWQRWQPDRLGIETVGYQEALQQQIMNQSLIPIVPIKKRGDKMMRITSMAPFFEQGRVWLRAALEDEPGFVDPETGVRVHQGMAGLMKELMQYPRTAHDDHLDALEMAISLGQMSPDVKRIIFDPFSLDQYSGKLVSPAMRQERPDELPRPIKNSIVEYCCPECHQPVTLRRLNDEYLCKACNLWALPERRRVSL